MSNLKLVDRASEVQQLIKDAIVLGRGITQVNESDVYSSIREGINELNRKDGDSEKALGIFFDALTASGGNKELQAWCLANLGDWVSKILKSQELAHSILEQAFCLTKKRFIQSKIRCMQAGIAINCLSESNEDKDKIISALIDCEKYAVEAIAFAGLASNVAEILQAESEALSMLVNNLLRYALPKYQTGVIGLIDDYLEVLSGLAGTSEVSYQEEINKFIGLRTACFSQFIPSK